MKWSLSRRFFQANVLVYTGFVLALTLLALLATHVTKQTEAGANGSIGEHDWQHRILGICISRMPIGIRELGFVPGNSRKLFKPGNMETLIGMAFIIVCRQMEVEPAT
jgi:hypothetical protein